jgi:hypothetical protein
MVSLIACPDTSVAPTPVVSTTFTDRPRLRALVGRGIRRRNVALSRSAGPRNVTENFLERFRQADRERSDPRDVAAGKRREASIGASLPLALAILALSTL